MRPKQTGVRHIPMFDDVRGEFRFPPPPRLWRTRIGGGECEPHGQSLGCLARGAPLRAGLPGAGQFPPAAGQALRLAPLRAGLAPPAGTPTSTPNLPCFFKSLRAAEFTTRYTHSGMALQAPCRNSRKHKSFSKLHFTGMSDGINFNRMIQHSRGMPPHQPCGKPLRN